MNRLEFVATCADGGYCTKKQAEEFAGDRDEFAEQDIIDAYRKYSANIPAPGKWNHQATDGGRNFCKTTYRSNSDGMRSNHYD